MLNRSVLSLLVVALALLASPGLTAPVVAQDPIIVDDDFFNCVDNLSPDWHTISFAVADADPGDTIHVCEGLYWEPFMHITKKLPSLARVPRDNDGVYGPLHGQRRLELFRRRRRVVIQISTSTPRELASSFGDSVGSAVDPKREHTAIQTYYSGIWQRPNPQQQHP
jgi:hypothetical protein